VEQTLNITQFWSVIRKRFLFIISLGLIFACMGGALASFFITPVYEASRQIVVNNTKSDQDLDYSDIIYSEVVLGKVIKDLDLKTNYKDLSKKIDVTGKKESQVITITVENADYAQAVEIVNKIASVFQNQAIKIMEIDNVELFPLTEMNPNPEPIHPKPILFTVVGLLAGLIIGVTISFLLQVFSNRITSERDIEELLNVPVIGSVPVVRPKDLTIAQTSEVESVRRTQSKGIGGKSIER
jgi:capsular polysaccharide biosynthesis protein